MKRLILFLLLALVPFEGKCVEKLHQDYLIEFGDPGSSIKIVHYFSFSCPHCVSLFKNDFQGLREKYINNKKVYCVFHPVPMDLLTVQAMDCLEKLNDKEKRIFLSAILEVISTDDSSSSLLFIQKAMECFNQPIPDLQDKEYLSQTQAFKNAFQFLKQEDKIEAVPVAEINGEIYPKDIPTIDFLENQIKNLLQE